MNFWSLAWAQLWDRGWPGRLLPLAFAACLLTPVPHPAFDLAACLLAGWTGAVLNQFTPKLRQRWRHLDQLGCRPMLPAMLVVGEACWILAAGGLLALCVRLLAPETVTASVTASRAACPTLIVAIHAAAAAWLTQRARRNAVGSSSHPDQGSSYV